MRRHIVIAGFLLTLFTLLTVPSVPAVYYNVAASSYTTQSINDIKTVDINTLQKILESIDDPEIQEKLQRVTFNILKEKINSLNTQTAVSNILLIYIIFMHLVMTMLIGKPSLFRLYMNFLLVAALFSDAETKEELGKCASIRPYAVALIFYTFGAFLFRICNNKKLGIYLGILMYFIGSIIQLQLEKAAIDAST